MSSLIDKIVKEVSAAVSRTSAANHGDSGGRSHKFQGGRPQLASPEERPELVDQDQQELQMYFMKEDRVTSAYFTPVLKKNAEKLLKKGVDISSMIELGAGSFGVAFDIGNQKVFKVTGDKSEAQASFSLIDKTYPNIVKVYDVFKFQDSRFYGLILEKLTPLTVSEKFRFRDAVEGLHEVLEVNRGAFVDLKGSDWLSFKDYIMQEASENRTEDIAETALYELEHFEVDKMADDLHSAGVAFLDYHAGNVMKKGSKFVITDLGVSQTAGAGEPPVLERRLREEAESDIDPKKLPDNPEEKGYNEDGFKLQDRFEFQELPISIEQAKGSSREWTDHEGNSGKTKMVYAYGYIEDSEGADGDSVDVYVGPDEDSEWVYVIHQMKTPEFVEFDEDKCMIGFDSEEEAKEAYLKHYDKDDFYGGMSVMKMQDFKKKLEDKRSQKITNENRKRMKEAGDLFGGSSSSKSQPADGSKPLTDPGQVAGSDPKTEAGARQIIEKNKEKLMKRGYDVSSAKALGQGTQGTAFDIGSGQVLKITKDSKEAQASNKIKGDKLKYVCNITDVFRFKDDLAYGIVQEQLKQLSAEEKKDFNSKLIFTGLPVWLKKAQSWDAATESVFNYVEKKKAKGDVQSPEGKRMIQWADQFMDSLENEYNVRGSWEELKGKGVSFSDYQADNLMKRGSEYVLIDIGLSDVSGGTEPDVLEKLVREAVTSFFLSEDSDDNEKNNIPDNIGVTIGRYQPFHKGHADLVRKLAGRFTKVIILIAGNNNDKEENPFSYESRIELMKKSLRDIEPKIEIHKAKFNGKSSGYIPGIISDIINDTKSSIKPENAINILVGEDRFDEFSKQIEQAKANPDKFNINPSLINIQKLPRTNEDEVSGYSGTKIRQALMKNDKATVEKMLDPLVTSDPAGFDNIYAELRDQLGVNERLEEQSISRSNVNLVSIGGEKTILKILQTNATKLLKKQVTVANLKPLGHGEMGIAYDMGGDKVLKVTTDESEAKSSNLIKGKQNLKHIVRIDDVFQFPNTDPPIYGIKSEKLDDLTEQDIAQVKRAFDFIDAHENIVESMATDTWEVFVEKLYTAIEYDVTKESKLDPEIPGAKNKIRKLAVRRHEFITFSLKELKVDQMMKELRQVGIEFADYHEGNIMKRQGDFVINDLGLSKSNGAAPPILEKIMSTLMNDIAFGFGSSQIGAQGSQWSNGGNMFTDQETDPEKKER